jgi:hypothetical protein
VDSQWPLLRPPERSGTKHVRRLPLANSEGKAVENVAQAIAELNRLRTQRTDETLSVLGRTPTFVEFAKKHLDTIKVNKEKKVTQSQKRKPSSICGKNIWGAYGSIKSAPSTSPAS